MLSLKKLFRDCSAFYLHRTEYGQFNCDDLGQSELKRTVLKASLLHFIYHRERIAKMQTSIHILTPYNSHIEFKEEYKSKKNVTIQLYTRLLFLCRSCHKNTQSSG